MHFNSRPHEEVDGQREYGRLGQAEFQLTTSRRGRHYSHNGEFCEGHISTHDLTKRSTISPCRMPYRSNIISTHDLTKRSTLSIRVSISLMRYFNSRPHEEVDGAVVYGCEHRKRISTHDLTKRSTGSGCCAANCAKISTHDLTKRSTSVQNCSICWWSISTHDLTKRST